MSRESEIMFYDEKVGRGHKRKVAMIDPLWNSIVEVYNSCSDASRQTGICKNTISLCCRDMSHKRTAGGFVWRYVAHDRLSAKNIPTEKGVYKIDPRTYEILDRYDTLVEACKENNIKQPNLTTCVRGERLKKTVGGYYWIRV